MTVGEFQRYASSHKPSKISFWTENQPWYSITDPKKAKMSFTTMLICENPNMLCLKCVGGNELCFDQIKYIQVEEDKSLLGTIITVFCGPFKSDDADISYVLIAS